MNILNAPVDERIDLLVPKQADFTPYEAAKIASRIVGDYVREQMLYNYVGKGYIPSTVGVRQTNKGVREVKVILRDDFVKWVRAYANKKLGR